MTRLRDLEREISGFELRWEQRILSCPRTPDRLLLKRPKPQADHLRQSSDWLRMGGAMRRLTILPLSRVLWEWVKENREMAKIIEAIPCSACRHKSYQSASEERTVRNSFIL